MMQAVAAIDFAAGAEPNDDLAEALAVYLDYGRSRFPRARTAALVERFGPEDATRLKQRIQDLQDEMRVPLHEEDRRTRRTETERACERLRRRHPELSAPAVAALGWAYAFGQRIG
jgi:hypothetical protein